MIEFADSGTRKGLEVKLKYRQLDPVDKEFLSELIKYTFPEYTFNQSNFAYHVIGDYNQYVLFGRLLKRFGQRKFKDDKTAEKALNLNQLRHVLAKKIQEKKILVSDLEGRFDEDTDFQESIESRLPNSSFDLYDEQKRGIAFLCGRKHALLGDETGLGKTVQLLSAAEIMMQDTGKPTLIFTLNATQQQWVREIENVVGETEISTDPSNPKRWTVLYYEMFSRESEKVNRWIETLLKFRFRVAIFDEIHKLKHSRSNRSKAILKIVKYIPYRWGASATISANAPIDVKNQLAIIGHHLGRINEKKFKKDFSGYEYNHYTGKLEKSEDTDIRVKAAERLNRWLNLSGVYIRRSKRDVRDMPNISVNHSIIPMTSEQKRSLFNTFLEKVKDYKDQNLPISRMIAARDILSQIKVTETVRQALEIVANNTGAASKIVIFTNFKKTGKLLSEHLNVGLKELNPDYSLLEYLGDIKKSRRDEIKNTFIADDNAKIIVMSMKMGSTGIDFPNAAQNMIINDFDWTPESAEQSEGRIYRINTNHDVSIHYVLLDYIDSEIFAEVQNKRSLAKIVQLHREIFQETNDQSELQKIVEIQDQIQDTDNRIGDIIKCKLPRSEVDIPHLLKSDVSKARIESAIQLTIEEEWQATESLEVESSSIITPSKQRKDTAIQPKLSPKTPPVKSQSIKPEVTEIEEKTKSSLMIELIKLSDDLKWTHDELNQWVLDTFKKPIKSLDLGDLEIAISDLAWMNYILPENKKIMPV